KSIDDPSGAVLLHLIIRAIETAGIMYMYLITEGPSPINRCWLIKL
ncbi:7450_t:CDS:1, partial [Gigaspora rosea]